MFDIIQAADEEILSDIFTKLQMKILNGMFNLGDEKDENMGDFLEKIIPTTAFATNNCPRDIRRK